MIDEHVPSRILLVSDHYPPFIGGVQRQTQLLAERLSAKGHAVGVATVWQDSLRAYEDTDGFPVWRLRQLRTVSGLTGVAKRRHQPPYPDPVTAAQLRRVIKRFKPDIVHSSGWFSYSAAAALLGSNVPLVVSFREYGYICANASLLEKGKPCSGPGLRKCFVCSQDYFGGARAPIAVLGVWASKFLLRRKMAAAHSVSRFVRETVVPRVLGRRLGSIPNVVIPSFRDDSDDLGHPYVPTVTLPDEPFILFVGALRRVKGVDTLFAAYGQLNNRPPLVLLGTFENDTPEALPQGAIAVGGAPHAEVLRTWDRALFGVMPSLWPEPFGSAVHEAMSRGRAVIGTVPGGHEDMIDDGESGLLVHAGSVSELRDAMQSLIDDPDLRERLGRAARLKAREFTAGVAIPKLASLYREAERSGARQPPGQSRHE